MKTFKAYIYESGANTSWDDGEGNKLTLQDMNKAIEHIPVTDIPVQQIAHLGLHIRSGDVMKHRIPKVTLDKPIIMMGDKILDGNHRLAKAIQDNQTHIQAKRFNITDLHKDHQPVFNALFGQ